MKPFSRIAQPNTDRHEFVERKAKDNAGLKDSTVTRQFFFSQYKNRCKVPKSLPFSIVFISYDVYASAYNVEGSTYSKKTLFVNENVADCEQ